MRKEKHIALNFKSFDFGIL